MAMQLQEIVPFGRSFNEYCRMFNLSSADFAGQIIGIGDGPASFNAAATQQGFNVISVDPVYQFSGAEIQSRFDAVIDDIIEQIKNSPDDWVWSYHASPEDLRSSRKATLQAFLQDYDSGKAAGRYVIGKLPQLAFPSQQFSLALCSHLLLLYSQQLDVDFHLQSIQEMLRIATEVRIFPLLTLMRERSPHLDAIMTFFREAGYSVALQTVTYELQKGGNQMLVIRP